MQSEGHSEILSRFGDARILVVGDLYLDENVYGKVTGVSLEAPIPIFEVHARRYNPGAAGNTACNLAALGAATSLVGVIGEDGNAGILRDELTARGIDASGIVVDPSRPTNTYGKLRAGGHNIPGQEVLRTDTPRPPLIPAEIEDKVVAGIEKRAQDVHAIVVVDQVSSVVTDRVLETVVACAKKNGIPAIGDSRERIGAFKNFDIVVPNDREAKMGTVPSEVRAPRTVPTFADAASVDASVPFLADAGTALLAICKNALITCGPAGITVFSEDGIIVEAPASARSVVDVTGAGDTVTAAVALSVVSGASLHEAAVIANAAAAAAVAQHGVVAITRQQVEAVLDGAEPISKVKDPSELSILVRGLQEQGKKVVWTNGCFDILHVGHISYLVKAAREGDVLVVGLNSDASVRAVKGPDRPINSESDRALVLSALECVDYLTVFSDPTTVPLLETLRPDVYTKGGDYTIETVNQDERRVVEGYGGKIVIIPGVEGKSTTDIVNRIAQRNR